MSLRQERKHGTIERFISYQMYKQVEGDRSFSELDPSFEWITEQGVIRVQHEVLGSALCPSKPKDWQSDSMQKGKSAAFKATDSPFRISLAEVSNKPGHRFVHVSCNDVF